jgi:ABC-type antimicrobial peptide transport system permease subunit
LFIRTRLNPQTIATALTREVHVLDPDLAPYEVITLQEQLDRSTSAQLVAVTLVGVLGGLALLLSVIGLYGVMSYAVSQSTRELGLRMPLGAGAANLLRLVMSRGLTLTASGVLLGAAVAFLLTRLLGNLLFQVSPRDPVAFASAFIVNDLRRLGRLLPPRLARHPHRPSPHPPRLNESASQLSGGLQAGASAVILQALRQCQICIFA